MIPKPVSIIRNEHDKHWQAFRAEAAREFTAAIVQIYKNWQYQSYSSNKYVVKLAIDLADELVKQLKEKGGEE